LYVKKIAALILLQKVLTDYKLFLIFRERIDRMKEEERLEKEAMERRLRKDLITKTFPKTREDFDQLYAMVCPH
jgi:hypothetical protein